MKEIVGTISRGPVYRFDDAKTGEEILSIHQTLENNRWRWSTPDYSSPPVAWIGEAVKGANKVLRQKGYREIEHELSA